MITNYNCDNGFSLVGNSSRTCTGDGSSTTGAFDGAAPTCERKCIIMLLLLDILIPLPPYSPAITFPGVPTPNNGNIDFGGASLDENGTYIFAVVATYVCDTGFYLVGNDSRICTGDGMSVNGGFNGTAPTCDRECSSHTTFNL